MTAVSADRSSSRFIAVVAVVSGAAAVQVPAADADRAEPAPLYGYYDAFLEHAKQTFNGSSIASESATQLGLFTTRCDASGCVSHWLRETELVNNPNAPALYTYTWANERWESRSEYPYPAARPAVRRSRP